METRETASIKDTYSLSQARDLLAGDIAPDLGRALIETYPTLSYLGVTWQPTVSRRADGSKFLDTGEIRDYILEQGGRMERDPTVKEWDRAPTMREVATLHLAYLDYTLEGDLRELHTDVITGGREFLHETVGEDLLCDTINTDSRLLIGNMWGMPTRPASYTLKRGNAFFALLYGCELGDVFDSPPSQTINWRYDPTRNHLFPAPVCVDFHGTGRQGNLEFSVDWAAAIRGVRERF